MSCVAGRSGGVCSSLPQAHRSVVSAFNLSLQCPVLSGNIITWLFLDEKFDNILMVGVTALALNTGLVFFL